MTIGTLTPCLTLLEVMLNLLSLPQQPTNMLLAATTNEQLYKAPQRSSFLALCTADAIKFSYLKKPSEAPVLSFGRQAIFITSFAARRLMSRILHPQQDKVAAFYFISTLHIHSVSLNSPA